MQHKTHSGTRETGRIGTRTGTEHGHGTERIVELEHEAKEILLRMTQITAEIAELKAGGSPVSSNIEDAGLISTDNFDTKKGKKALARTGLETVD